MGFQSYNTFEARDNIHNALNDMKRKVETNVKTLHDKAVEYDSITADLQVNLAEGKELHKCGFEWNPQETLRNQIFQILKHLVEENDYLRKSLNAIR